MNPDIEEYMSSDLGMLYRAVYNTVLTYNIPIVYQNGVFTFWDSKLRNKIYIIPGSFNPLHDGHRELFRIANGMAVREFPLPSIFYEMALDNRTKGVMSEREFVKRILGFKHYEPVIITSSAYFIDKVDDFHGIKVDFMIGADVACRMIKDHEKEDLEDLEDVTFRVFDRIINGELFSLPEDHPKNFFRYMQLSGYLATISSTQIRNEENKNEDRKDG